MKEDKSRGHFTPVVDVKLGVSVDYDVKDQVIYWTEVSGEKQNNGTLYKSDKLSPEDYASVTDNVTDFLLNKERGLEQFYEIMRQGTVR